MSIKISVAIITFNEEKNIKRCIDSISKLADEIVVVDSLSSDNTCSIAKSLNATVIDQKFLGHIAQKQLAVDNCKNNWILSLDADEEISEELEKSIMNLIKNTFEYDAYSLNRVSFHLGVWIRHGGWYPDKKIRLFNKAKAYWGGYNPHDKVIVNGNIGHLQGDLLHYVFKDYSSSYRESRQKANKSPLLNVQRLRQILLEVHHTIVNKIGPRYLFEIFMTYLITYAE